MGNEKPTDSQSNVPLQGSAISTMFMEAHQ